MPKKKLLLRTINDSNYYNKSRNKFCVKVIYQQVRVNVAIFAKTV